MDNQLIQSHLGLFRWPLVGYGVVCPLALVGLVLSLIGRERIGVLYLMCAFYVVTVAVLFFVAARYRLPIVPYFLILASGAIVWLAGQLRVKRYYSPSRTLESQFPLVLRALRRRWNPRTR